MSTGLEEGQITIYFQLQVQGWQKILQFVCKWIKQDMILKSISEHKLDWADVVTALDGLQVPTILGPNMKRAIRHFTI